MAIPAYNEEKFIGPLLDEISAHIKVDHILVVNDGSQDRTGAIAQAKGVTLVEHRCNRGKGETIKTAFSFARQREFDWIIFLDGDGQHPPQHLPDFFDGITADKADVILGNRQARARNMPFHRQLSNGITSILVSLCAGGRRILDSQCGFRAVRLRKMTGITFASAGFQVESEMLIKLGKSGAAFAHVPIQTVYGEQKSSIRLVADTLKFLQLLTKSFWW